MKKSLNGVSIESLSAARKALVRKMLRKEFTNFFVAMTTSTDEWPHVTDEELVDALADSLIAMGHERKLGTALLQTLIYELQERVNAN